MPGDDARVSHLQLGVDAKGKGSDRRDGMADREAGTVIEIERRSLASRRPMGVGGISSAREGGDMGYRGGKGG
jgi:hypothetical protein